MRSLYRADAAERERVVHTVTVALESEPDLVYAYLHGSFLTDGDFHDVDVGVHFGTPADQRLTRVLNLAARLTREAGFPVDVRALDDAPLAFRFQVFRTGRLLLTRDEERLADCMERTIREYLDIEPLLRQATVEAFGA
ncbi:MAG: nucleotidyltransferase domain-containing protein [Gammaproteobacteria bacterium]|nr:nucleotidyltransferase domain-containing protein [Gammaproteobacteria bacterium]